MGMKTVLVSGASGIIGYGALKGLKQSGHELRLIGTTIYDNSIAPAFCDIFELAPKTSDPGYLRWLLDIIHKHGIDLIIPGIEADIVKWNGHREEIKQAGAFALLNNPSLIELCADKWLFYKALEKSGSALAIPTRIDGSFDSLVSEFGLPLLVKPRRGSGSKGIFQISARAEFDRIKQEYGADILTQPLVGEDSEEYTVSGFFDQDSLMLDFICLKRNLAKDGYTGTAETRVLPGAEDSLKELADVFKPVGPTNFQFRSDKGRLKLLEINPRISSASSLRTAFGYNEIKMSLEYFLEGRRPEKSVIRPGRAVRYTEDHIFYDA
jgi:carbamoyl-phosphate synthase large subunit